MRYSSSSAAATATITTSAKGGNSLISFEHKRDAYGFAVRPQHVQRYREYANIYKEEEEERSNRWNDFLERQAESAQLPTNGISSEEGKEASHAAEDGSNVVEKGAEVDDLPERKSGSDSLSENDTEKEKVQSAPEKRVHQIQIWTEIRPILQAIEDMMSMRVKKKGILSKEQKASRGKPLTPTEDARSPKGASEEDSDDEFYDAERSDPVQDSSTSGSGSTGSGGAADAAPTESSLFPWKEELEVLVRGGVPMALRGELWQAFVGVRVRRVENYYKDLLANETNSGNNTEKQSLQYDSKGSTTEPICGPQKWKGQIEKVVLLAISNFKDDLLEGIIINSDHELYAILKYVVGIESLKEKEK
ncbi:hypothetical protein V6N11_055471 [Hibiscus sabdariffa]|uniref:Rab-GAP TBC domain-containing protein n=1 Tax=Hibiscus sabdariffa TaxID=183260 RepID=A0ABR2PFG4_9ROSI